MTRKKRATALKDEVHAFLLKSGMEKVCRYLQDGQQLEFLSDADLRSEWTKAFKRCSVNPSDPRSRRLADDLQAEMAIRLIEPPFGRVRREAEALMEFANQAHERLKTNPSRQAEANDDLHADIQAMKRRRETSAKN